MLMAMVYVRKVRMSVSCNLAPERMRMEFLTIPREIVFVPVMRVVAVFMGTFDDAYSHFPRRFSARCCQ